MTRALFLLLPFAFCLLPSRSQAAVDLTRGLDAFDRRQWMEAMQEFISALHQDPSNAQARAYIDLVARQIDNERRAERREKRLTLLEDASRRLEENRQDTQPLQQAITETATAEQRARQDRWRLLCEEARMKRESGQLPAAHDLIFQVLTENASYAPAQRELSELQSALRRALDRGDGLPVMERYVFEGFYAYGQADYENALVAWRKARALIDPGVPAAAAAARLAALKFPAYEEKAQAQVQAQQQGTELRRWFDQGLELYRSGRFIESLEIFRRVAIKDPNYPLLGHYLVKAEVGADEERARRLGEQKRQQLNAFYEGATAALQAERFEEAMRGFEAVLRLDSTHAQARAYLAMAKAEMERRLDPEAARLRYENGLVAYAGGKLEEAAREWRLAAKLDPRHDKARLALGRVQKELAMSRRSDELPAP